VWDREMILTAIAEFYGKDMDAFQKDLVHNFTTVRELPENNSSKQRNMRKIPAKLF
jgi:hypothetical protein